MNDEARFVSKIFSIPYKSKPDCSCFPVFRYPKSSQC